MKVRAPEENKPKTRRLIMKMAKASGVGWYLSVPKIITKAPAKTSKRLPTEPIDT